VAVGKVATAGRVATAGKAVVAGRAAFAGKVEVEEDMERQRGAGGVCRAEGRSCQ